VGGTHSSSMLLFVIEPGCFAVPDSSWVGVECVVSCGKGFCTPRSASEGLLTTVAPEPRPMFPPVDEVEELGV